MIALVNLMLKQKIVYCITM